MANKYNKLVKELTTYGGDVVRYYDFDDVRCFDDEDYRKAKAKNKELLDKALEEAEDLSEIDVLSDAIMASYEQNWVSGNGCESKLNKIRVYDFSKIDWEKSENKIYSEFYKKAKVFLKNHRTI